MLCIPLLPFYSSNLSRLLCSIVRRLVRNPLEGVNVKQIVNYVTTGLLFNHSLARDGSTLLSVDLAGSWQLNKSNLLKLCVGEGGRMCLNLMITVVNFCLFVFLLLDYFILFFFSLMDIMTIVIVDYFIY